MSKLATNCSNNERKNKNPKTKITNPRTNLLLCITIAHLFAFFIQFFLLLLLADYIHFIDGRLEIKMGILKWNTTTIYARIK